jgi:hypothetical protein
MRKYYYSTTSCKKGGKSKQSNGKEQTEQWKGQTEQWKEQTEQWKGFYFLLNGKPKDLQLKVYCHKLC